MNFKESKDEQGEEGKAEEVQEEEGIKSSLVKGRDVVKGKGDKDSKLEFSTPPSLVG